VLCQSTNVFEMVNVPFPISVIAMAIPGRFSGRASDGSVTVVGEEMKTKYLLCYLHKCKKHRRDVMELCIMEKEIKKNLSEVCCKEKETSKESVGKL